MRSGRVETVWHYLVVWCTSFCIFVAHRSVSSVCRLLSSPNSLCSPIFTPFCISLTLWPFTSRQHSRSYF
ncbi:hypothetical protein B0H63DRAFT_470017 [Podospora didyma]|uniref:Uncharacterized protein n=1 Tax=Podospora didyma TaxID=330526 RepID=A0AAE0NU08_9PEZI|nr:hypothetical protein B0H63DRAFT_470017 [Podospora didyma]